MICYACNTDYPQQPAEPFWICPNCKRPEEPEHKILTTPKVFYEIEKPAKKTYAVVVFEVKEECECRHAEPIFNKKGHKRLQQLCESGSDGEEIFECACCGMPTCQEHLSKIALHNELVCKVCAKLPVGLMESILMLRLELNRA